MASPKKESPVEPKHKGRTGEDEDSDQQGILPGIVVAVL